LKSLVFSLELALVVPAPAALSCRSREAPAAVSSSPSRAASSASVTRSAATRGELPPPAVTAEDLANAPGPLPAGSAVARAVRETAVLALLADPTFVRRAPVVALEPEREFDWTLRERLAPRIALATPKLRFLDAKTDGPLPSEIVQRIVRQSFGRFRTCYATALTTNPTLRGVVKLELSIEKNGKLSSVTSTGSTLTDPKTLACIVDATRGLEFPAQEAPTRARESIELSPAL